MEQVFADLGASSMQKVSGIGYFTTILVDVDQKANFL